MVNVDRGNNRWESNEKGEGYKERKWCLGDVAAQFLSSFVSTE